jgi:hypothetical protein
VVQYVSARVSELSLFIFLDTHWIRIHDVSGTYLYRIRIQRVSAFQVTYQCCTAEKYKQIARSIESLLDLSTMSIEEAIRRLKVVDGDEPQPLSGPITVGGKLHLTREQWEA